MIRAISCHLFLYHDLLNERVLESIKSAGFDKVELWAMQPHIPYRDEKAILKISEKMKSAGVEAVSAHSPMYTTVHGPGKPRGLISASDPDEAQRSEWLAEFKLAAEASALLGAKILTLHTDIKFSAPDPARMKSLRKSIDDALLILSKTEMKLAIENTPGGPKQVDGVIDIVREYRDEKIGITLDVGHAMIDTDLLAAVRSVGQNLLSAHAHDNDGSKDDHMMPGRGAIPWRDLKKAFDAINFNGPLVWEIRDPLAGNDPGLKTKIEMLKELKKFDDDFSQPG